MIASLVMGAALWFVADALEPWFGAATGFLTRTSALAMLVGAGLAVYAVAVLALGILDLRQLRGSPAASASRPYVEASAEPQSPQCRLIIGAEPGPSRRREV